MIDLTLGCPTCGRRADMCFDHGDDWKKRSTVGNFFVRHTNGEYVLWGPMGDPEFIGKYSAHRTASAAWAEARARHSLRRDA